MQCPNCDHDNKDGVTFCEKCGAQLLSEKKRLSFLERRQAKERERLYILSKASLQAEDVENIRDLDLGEVKATPLAEKKSVLSKTALIFSAAIIGIVIGIALIFVVGRLRFNDTARVAIIFVLFVLCAVSGAYSLDYGYRLRMIKAMSKSRFAVKKISYGKPPVMLSGEIFYSLEIVTPCDIEGCGSTMHIEEYNGEFIAVCDADRAHLRRLDCSLLSGKAADDKSSGEQCGLSGADSGEENNVED